MSAAAVPVAEAPMETEKRALEKPVELPKEGDAPEEVEDHGGFMVRYTSPSCCLLDKTC